MKIPYERVLNDLTCCFLNAHEYYDKLSPEDKKMLKETRGDNSFDSMVLDCFDTKIDDLNLDGFREKTPEIRGLYFLGNHGAQGLFDGAEIGSVDDFIVKGRGYEQAGYVTFFALGVAQKQYINRQRTNGMGTPTV